MLDNKPCILCVDDFDAHAIKEFIERRFDGNVVVVPAIGIEEAKQILASRRGQIDVAVLDVFVPDSTAAGLDLGREIAADIPIFFISGHPVEEFAARAHGLVPVAFMEKTGDWRDRLVNGIRNVLEPKEDPEPTAADREYARLRSYSFGHTPGAVATVRFHLPELPEGQDQSPAESLWDFGPLCVAIRYLESYVHQHHGRIVHCDGLSARVMFPAVGAELGHFEQAIRSLVETSQMIERRRAGGFDVPWFSAGIVHGTIVTGLVGERNPGHSALIGRLGDFADQMAIIARPQEIGAIDAWLHESERAVINSLGTECRHVNAPILGIQSPVQLLMIQL